MNAFTSQAGDYEYSYDVRPLRERSQRCQCASPGEWPGTCPGPDSCPYSDRAQEIEDAEIIEIDEENEE
jgi:hypothetical protein